MKTVRIIHAEKKSHFALAETFVLPYEKKFLALMERIQKNEPSIFLIAESDDGGTDSCGGTGSKKVAGEDSIIGADFKGGAQAGCGAGSKKVAGFKDGIILIGVFSYTPGKAFTPCIPEFTGSAVTLLKSFLREHRVFCLTGTVDGVKKIAGLIKEARGEFPQDKRQLILMRWKESGAACLNELPVQKKNEIIKCTKNHVNELMPLHLSFVREEVLPPYYESSKAFELLNLERILKRQYVFAVEKDGLFMAKAQTNAVTKNYMQIGGVYTRKEFRGNGYACALVRRIAALALKKKKTCMLYVRRDNVPALKCYEKAGFIPEAELSMFYF